MNNKSYSVNVDAEYFIFDKGLYPDSFANLTITDVNSDNYLALKDRLNEYYDSDTVLNITDSDGDKKILLSDFHCKSPCSVSIAGKDFLHKKRFGMNDLLRIVYRLRAPDGCKWDREQTHKTIRANVVEEAYELVEAINLNSVSKMVEESGDVLLQGIFHSIIAEGDSEYTTADMLSVLCEKLVNRHTHIFGDTVANTPEEALRSWENAKAKEKSQEDYHSRFESIAVTLPANTRAYKTQKIAAKVKFEWSKIEEVEEKLQEEIKEFLTASEEEKEMEGGDLLFAAINLLRWRKVDPELALNRSTKKFVDRLSYVERKLQEKSLTMDTASVEEMWKLYDESKLYYKS